jgi:hypothetical protein
VSERRIAFTAVASFPIPPAPQQCATVATAIQDVSTPFDPAHDRLFFGLFVAKDYFIIFYISK